MSITVEDRRVCLSESREWLACLDDLPPGAVTAQTLPCVPHQDTFLNCVAVWRALPDNAEKFEAA